MTHFVKLSEIIGPLMTAARQHLEGDASLFHVRTRAQSDSQFDQKEPMTTKMNALGDAVADFAVTLECLQEHVNTLAGVPLESLPVHVRQPLALLLGAAKGLRLDELTQLADDVLAVVDGE